MISENSYIDQATRSHLRNLNMPLLMYLIFFSVGVHNIFFGNSTQAVIQNWNESKCGKMIEVIQKNFSRTITKGEFPWQAMIVKRTNNDTEFLCSGILIHKYLVLTDASCTQNIHVRKLFVLLGATDVNNTLINDSTLYKVSKIIYESSMPNKNAFSVLKLKSAADEMPVCLSNSNSANITKHCYLVGRPIPSLQDIIKEKENYICSCKQEDNINRVSKFFTRLYEPVVSYFTDILKPKQVEKDVCLIKKALFWNKIPVKYNPKSSSIELRSFNKYNTSLLKLYNEMSVAASVVCRLAIPTKTNTCYRKEPMAQFKSWYAVVGLTSSVKTENATTANVISISNYMDFIKAIIKYEV